MKLKIGVDVVAPVDDLVIKEEVVLALVVLVDMEHDDNCDEAVATVLVAVELEQQ